MDDLPFMHRRGCKLTVAVAGPKLAAIARRAIEFFMLKMIRVGLLSEGISFLSESGCRIYSIRLYQE